MKKSHFLLLVIGLLVLCTGCVQEKVDGETYTYTNELWVPLVVMLGGILAIPTGWFLRSVWSKGGWILLIVGPIAAIGFAPSLFRDLAIIDNDRFFVRTGIWGMTSVHEVKFDEVTQISITAEKRSGRRSRGRKNFYLLCSQKNGSSEKIPLGNKVVEEASLLFLTKAKLLEIPIIDATHLN